MINLERLPNWRGRLEDYLDDMDGVPFAWGTNDCATFAAGVINAMTGHDFSEGHRGAYDTPEGAAEYLSGMGFSGYDEFIAATLPEKSTSEAAFGDIAIVDIPVFGVALGVFMGHTVKVMTFRGMGVVPRSKATKAFGVGKP